MATDTALGAMKYLNARDTHQRFLMHSICFRKWSNCGLTWFDNLAYPLKIPYPSKDKAKISIQDHNNGKHQG